MYAIIEVSGRQWKVEQGTRLDINRIPGDAGTQLPVERVLFAYDGAEVHVGRPYVDGASVVCEVVEHRQGPKTIAYHFRRRENWRKTVGHRQPLTRVVVKEIRLPGGAAAPARAAAAVVPAKASAKAKTARVSHVTRKKPTLKPKTKES